MEAESTVSEALLQWLLETENASVRYFTLRDVLGREEKDPEVRAVKASIPGSKVVTKIFSKQKGKGYWGEPCNPYHPKYKSSYWQIMILGQLGMDKTDQRVRKACEYIFQFQHAQGGFSCQTRKTALREYLWHLKKGKKMPTRKEWVSSTIFEGQLSCLTGNMVAALLRLGYKNDSRVKRALAWLMKIQNKDGGWLCPYWRAHIKDEHGCFYGTICPLEAFSEVPKKNRTKEMKKTIKRGAEFMLMHRLFKRDHHDYKVINRAWTKLGFPWFSGYNILRGLDVLTKLGYTNDERLADAVEIVLQKRCKDGKWILESAPTGRMHANLETKDKPSKWMTLIALRVLGRIHRFGGKLDREMISYYDARASEYDEFYFGKGPAIPGSQSYTTDVEKIAKIVQKFGKGHLIDIACGTGFWVPYYAQNCTLITLIDQSEKMLSECTKRVNNLGLRNKCSFIHGDFYELTFEDGVFDSALVGFLISHLSPQQEQIFFQKVKKILKPHGQLMLIDSSWSRERKKYRKKEDMQKRKLNSGRTFTIYKRYFNKSDIIKMFNRHGFKLETYYMGNVFLTAIGKR